VIAVIALWVVLILSVFSLTLGAGVGADLDLRRYYNIETRSYHYARSGVFQAIRVLNGDETPELDHRFENWFRSPDLFKDVEIEDGWFNVTYGDFTTRPPFVIRAFGVVDEDSKVNINTASRDVLLRLPEMTEAIADCILDWIDVDDESRRFGAERPYYENNKLPYSCGNGELECLEELLMVKGVTTSLLESWRPFVTVRGYDAVNVLTAPKEVLVALGVPESLADDVVDMTTDASRIKELEDPEKRSAEGFIVELRKTATVDQSDDLLLRSLFNGGVLKFDSRVFRIVSQGSVPIRQNPGFGLYYGTDGDQPSVLTVSVQAVVSFDDEGQAQIMYWREN
jgi:hypothetical protein